MSLTLHILLDRAEAEVISSEMLLLQPMDIISYNCRMEFVLQARDDVAAVEELFSELVTKGLKPNQHTYNSKFVA